jgi:N-acyl-D-amino-acid deacylase
LKGELYVKAEKIADDYGINLSWSSLDEYYKVLENQGVSLNVASLVGHGTIRASIMSYENRAPTRTELEEMKNLLDSSMKCGAFGISTGLIYPPGSYARTDELVDLCKVASKNEGFYSSHVRFP